MSLLVMCEVKQFNLKSYNIFKENNNAGYYLRNG